jgi:hypothetical protein
MLLGALNSEPERTAALNHEEEDARSSEMPVFLICVNALAVR